MWRPVVASLKTPEFFSIDRAFGAADSISLSSTAGHCPVVTPGGGELVVQLPDQDSNVATRTGDVELTDARFMPSEL